MSGRNHHYLPRFLLRPFAYRQNGKEFYVHAHHRVRGAYSPNVAGLASERDFYGGPEDTALDDAITQAEGRLGEVVHALNNGEAVEQVEIAELVSALSIRTKAMREAFKGLLPTLLEVGRAQFLSERLIRRQYHDSLKNPKKARELIDRQLRKEFPSDSREMRARKRVFFLAQWPSFVATHEEQFVADLKRYTHAFLDYALTQAEAIADKSFLEVLSRGPSTPKRVERFAQEMRFDTWEVREDEFFVLGDCGPVAMFSDGVPRLALGAMGDGVEMESVFLPIAPNRCIVGLRGLSGHGLSAEDVNRMSAVLSREFVASHLKEHESLASLLHLIGTQAPIETEEGIIRALSEDEEDSA